MPKRPHESDDLLEQLKLVRDDPLQVQGILENQNMATIANVITWLLTASDTAAPDHAKRQKKAHNRPRMLNELFVEVMLFMDRDSLDSMQLVCRFMLDYIRQREATELALRRILKFTLGGVNRDVGLNPGDGEHWLPVMRLCRDDDEQHFLCLHCLLPYLRLAYCQRVDVTLVTVQSATVGSYAVACGMLFGGFDGRCALDARSVDVDSLTVCSDQGTVNLLNRCIDAFKSVRVVTMKTTSDELIDPEAFNEVFFASLVHRGVRYFRSEMDFGQALLEIDAKAALAFAFAEPTDGVSRELSGAQCNNGKDFMQLVRKKAGELGSRQRVELKAALSIFTDHVDPTGFEKYRAGEGRWVVNDLDNGLNLEIKQAEDFTVVIHLYSST